MVQSFVKLANQIKFLVNQLMGSCLILFKVVIMDQLTT